MMIRPSSADHRRSVLWTRLSRLAALTPADHGAIEAAVSYSLPIHERRESVNVEQTEPRLIAAGWAARVRLLSDGRRQILHILLPGDLIGHAGVSRGASSLVALTPLVLVRAPQGGSTTLAEAYEVGRMLETRQLFDHLVRLGRLTALERITDLMLELHERLTLCGLVTQNSFDMPLTQEELADTLGLTPVHVNRVLQAMRRAGELIWNNGQVTLPDPAAMAARIGRMPIVLHPA